MAGKCSAVFLVIQPAAVAAATAFAPAVLVAAAIGRAAERPSQLAQSIEKGLLAAQRQLHHATLACRCTSPSAMD